MASPSSIRVLTFDFVEVLKARFPFSFQRARHNAVVGIDSLVSPLSMPCFVPSLLEPRFPLCFERARLPACFLFHGDRQIDLFGYHGREEELLNMLVEMRAFDRPADVLFGCVLAGTGVAPRRSFVGRVIDTHALPAAATQQDR